MDFRCFLVLPRKGYFCCLNPQYMNVFIAALLTVSYKDSSEPFCTRQADLRTTYTSYFFIKIIYFQCVRVNWHSFSDPNSSNQYIRGTSWENIGQKQHLCAWQLRDKVVNEAMTLNLNLGMEDCDTLLRHYHDFYSDIDYYIDEIINHPRWQRYTLSC